MSSGPRSSFNFGFGETPGARRVEPEDPFQILVVADFSGRGSRGERADSAAIAGLRPVRVEVDTLDAVMARLDVHLRLDTDGTPIEIHAASLDDLHPDSLYRKVDLFRRLKDLRSRLAGAATYPAAAAEVREWLGGPEPAAGGADGGGPAAEADAASAADDIARLMGRPMSAPGASVEDAVSRLIRDAVGPSTPAAPPDQAALIAAVDRATSQEMRRVLHHPAFQELEAAWRGVQFLLTRLETGEELTVWILDAARMEVAVDLLSNDDLRRSGLYRLLAERPTTTPGVKPWSLIVLNEVFRARAADANVLARWAQVAHAGGAALLAGGHEQLFGCPGLPAHADPIEWTFKADDEAAATWGAVRQMGAARSVALASPRFLLRRPYGTEADEIDTFDFEEIPAKDYLSAGSHGGYLWGPSSLVLAVLLGRAFASEGWGLAAGHGGEVEGMAYHSWRESGSGVALPAAEAWLTTRAGEKMEAAGVCPILSVKGRDSVQVARVQSMAGTALQGGWSA
jgi:type VI secretion system protein ImpC